MRIRTGLSLTATLLAASIMLVTCAGNSQPSPPLSAIAWLSAAELPSITQLDALRGFSVVEGLAPAAPLASRNCEANGSSLDLLYSDTDIAWAVYRAKFDGAHYLQALAIGSGELWLVVADYASSSWVLPTPLTAGAATLDLTQVEQATSPAGYCYIAAACAQRASANLEGLSLELEAAPSGSEYYVIPGGSDDNTGLVGHPWLTLQHAADEVQAGDRVHVFAGNYDGFHLQSSGTAEEPIQFWAQPGVMITGDNLNTPDGINIENWEDVGISNVEIRGFTINNRTRAGIRVVGSDISPAHHIIVRGNHCDNNGTWGIFTGFVDNMLIEDNVCSHSQDEHGIYFSNSGDRVIIRRNTSFSNNACGIHMNGDESMGGDGTISYATVELNTIYDNGLGGGGSGINCDGVQDSVFRNNLLYGNHASGISLYQIDAAAPASNNIVVNNTIVMAADSRWCLNIRDGSFGAQVYNNILYNEHSWHGSISIDAAALAGFRSDYNVVMERFTPDDGDSVLDLAGWRGLTGQDTHSIVAAPAQLFTDTAGNDYTLSAASPARDAAYAGASPLYDILEAIRPLGAGFDIGAYETP